MIWGLSVLAILGITFGPQLWVRYTLKQNRVERPELQGTGGELAIHLIKRFGLKGVTVIEGRDWEDYYDPDTRTVSLSPSHYWKKSISAVAVATHEIGHAIQHKEGHAGFMKRQRRIKQAILIERISALVLMMTPLLFLITRIPQSTLLTVTIGAVGLLTSLWVQCINLPIEFDASFNKALPILADGYLSEEDVYAAQKVLKAAALTYVASALACLLNIGRWIMIFRR
ncbi:MAG: zinc metallopeptidase [Endozoicomonas sp. (ex Botrylloides leachii)]|nr:zinc metallopeptidase [Endozoicomonas sp. (ex Botrylloides leachii)]